MESLLKILHFSFFLIQILYQSASPLLHLVQSALKTDPIRCTVPLSMFDLLLLDGVLRMPNIMRDEFLDWGLPIWLVIIFLQFLQFYDETVNVLYQNIVASDEHAFLVLQLLLGRCVLFLLGYRSGPRLRCRCLLLLLCLGLLLHLSLWLLLLLLVLLKRASGVCRLQLFEVFLFFLFLLISFFLLLLLIIVISCFTWFLFVKWFLRIL